MSRRPSRAEVYYWVFLIGRDRCCAPPKRSNNNSFRCAAGVRSFCTANVCFCFAVIPSLTASGFTPSFLSNLGPSISMAGGPSFRHRSQTRTSRKSVRSVRSMGHRCDSNAWSRTSRITTSVRASVRCQNQTAEIVNTDAQLDCTGFAGVSCRRGPAGRRPCNSILWRSR